MQLYNSFKRFSDFVDRGVMMLVAAIITAMTLIITLQILCRTLFSALTWSEELSRYMLVWGSFFAATLAYKRGMHISVTAVTDLIPAKLRKYIIILGIILSMLFFTVAMIFGVKLMSMQAVQVSAALQLPMRWVYAAIPASFMIMLIHGIAAILEQLFGREGVNA